MTVSIKWSCLLLPRNRHFWGGWSPDRAETDSAAPPTWLWIPNSFPGQRFSRFDPNVTVAHQGGGERSDIWCYLTSSGDVREQIRHFFLEFGWLMRLCLALLHYNNHFGNSAVKDTWGFCSLWRSWDAVSSTLSPIIQTPDGALIGGQLHRLKTPEGVSPLIRAASSASASPPVISAPDKWRLTNTKPIHGKTSVLCVLDSRESAWKGWKHKVFFKFHIVLEIEKNLPPIVLCWALEMDAQ